MRRLAASLLFLSATGCALHTARTASTVAVATAPAPAVPAPAPAVTPAEPASCQVALATPEEREADEAEPETDVDPDGDADSAVAVDEEGESHDPVANDGFVGNRYTADVSDEQLQAEWKNSPEKLGSISLGFVDEGRQLNAVQFPCGEGWIVVSPERAWGTQETVDSVLAAIKQVRAQFPDSLPLRVNQISAKDGGYLRPHKSHQTGRDVDLAFYYPTVDPIRTREREKVIDVPRTWALLRAVITTSDVQMVLLDSHVQKVLYDYALKTGDDKAWLDSVFHGGATALVKHARHHRDHMHVRYFNARAQELGRRVAPLLAQRPEQNLVFHRVHGGDTLGAIARKYGTSVEGLRKANHLKGSMLHLAQVLRVPLRGPCTHCPIPPPVFVPARRLPPQLAVRTAVMTAPSAEPTAMPSLLTAMGPSVAQTSATTLTQAAVQPASQTVAVNASVPAAQQGSLAAHPDVAAVTSASAPATAVPAVATSATSSTTIAPATASAPSPAPVALPVSATAHQDMGLAQ